MTINTALQALSIRLPAGSLETYVSYVNQVPVLTADEELALTHRLQHTHDLEAAKKLILHHLRYVVRVAKSYRGYGLPLADLIQEGTIGLMKAVKRYRVDRGARLVTFAVRWIKAEIHEYVLRNWRIVKMATTKAQRKLFFNLRKAKSKLGWFSAEEAIAVAKDLGVKPEEVYEMEKRLVSNDTSFDSYSDESDDEDHLLAPAHYLEDKRFDPLAQLEGQNRERLGDFLHQALSNLDARSQEIIQARWLNDEKTTLETLAAQYKVSAERIRQLETNAMLKLKAALASEG